MSLSGYRMVRARDALQNGRQATTVICTHDEAVELKRFLVRNGIDVEVTREGDLQYRFRRLEAARDGHR